MLKFNQPICPKCGKPVNSVLQTIQGRALVCDGGWTGETDINWDSQANTIDRTGNITVACEDYHEWQTQMEEV